MKTIFTFLFLAIFALGASAQLAATIDFEKAESDNLWTIFANGTDNPDDITVVPNPNPSGINESENVLEFIVHDDASPWVGAWSDNFGPLAFTEDAHILTMMVLKKILSPAALKVEGSTDGGANQELKVTNTLTDEWELLTFDLKAASGFTYPRLVIFPDFPDARTGGTVAYLDNIAVATPLAVKNLQGSAIKTYPNPVDNVMYVQHPDMKSISISGVTGKTLKSFNFPTASSQSIALEDLPSGLYLITVDSKSGRFASKFVKR
jgi:hypothetical protein